MQKLNKAQKWNSSRPAIFASDFETFTPSSTYFKREGHSGVYCISSCRATIKTDETKGNGKRYVHKITKDPLTGYTICRNKNRTYEPQIFVNMADWLDFHRNYHDRYQIIYFHNFIKFDRHYLNAWLVETKVPAKEIYVVSSELLDYIWRDRDNMNNFLIKDDKPADCYAFEYAGSDFAIIKMLLWCQKDNKYKLLEIRDTTLLFQRISVEGMGKQLPLLKEQLPCLNIYSKVMDFDPDLVQEPLESVEILKEEYKVVYDRVLYDSLILAEYIKAYFINPKFLTDGTDIPYSLPQLALKKWLETIPLDETKRKIKKNGEKQQEYLQMDEYTEDVNRFFLMNNDGYEERTFYQGGITSFNKEYQNKLIKGPIYSYDINSMYPAQMVKLLPYGNPVFKNKLTKKDKAEKFIFVHVKGMNMTQINRNIPPLISHSWLTKEGKKSIEAGTTYLYEYNGPIEFCVSLQEAEIFFNKDYFLGDLYVEKYLVFNQKYVTKVYIEKYYKDKEDATNAIEKGIAKLFLNSLYGKFAQKPIKYVQIPKKVYNPSLVDKKEGLVEKRNFDSDYFKSFNYYKLPQHTYAPIAAAITSLARAFLMSSFLTLANNDPDLIIYYCDTDSMKVNKQLQDKSLIDPNKLGLWKFEGQFNYLKILRAKVYYAVSDTTKWTFDDKGKLADLLACSGVAPEQVIGQFMPNDLTLESEVYIKEKRYDTWHQPVLEWSYKRISNLQVK